MWMNESYVIAGIHFSLWALPSAIKMHYRLNKNFSQNKTLKLSFEQNLRPGGKMAVCVFLFLSELLKNNIDNVTLSL